MGCSKGDPLLPPLFIIVLELLALSIHVHDNDQIKGIAMGGSEIKLVIFADNMTSFVMDHANVRIAHFLIL